jgi:hypothetical protein
MAQLLPLVVLRIQQPLCQMVFNQFVRMFDQHLVRQLH